MADFLHHAPCPECKSRDALAVYSDGGTHCFRCKHTTKGDGAIGTETEVRDEGSNAWTPVEGEYRAIPQRGLRQETCEFWSYQVGEFKGKKCHIANIKDQTGRVIAQKLRLPGKEFPSLGNKKNKPLYGQWLWKNGGKHIVITEGELDALSVSQAMDLKWPVVSLPDGADSAEKAVTKAYDFLTSYERVVLMFDQDEPGRAAAEKVAELLPPGKVAIAVLPRKDANEVLKEDGPAPIIAAFWNAATWAPDGIIRGDDITLDDVMKEVPAGVPYPFPKLQTMMLGQRKGELTLWTAGSGIGKSTMVRELMYRLRMEHGCKIANIFLEENNAKTAQAYIAIDNSVPLGRLRFNPKLLSPEQWAASLKRVVHGGVMWFYKHFGSLESKKLINKVGYFARVCNVDHAALDHISIATSGMESSSEGERKDIDILMTRLRSVIEETGIGITAIVHLKRTESNFNEGGQVSLRDLRGSGSLEQLSDNVIAIERDQQGDKPTQMCLRVLKCRETGETGLADTLNYNRATGRIEIVEDVPFEDALDSKETE